MTIYKNGRQTSGQIIPLKGIIAATGYSPCIPIIGEITGWDMTRAGADWVTPETHRVVLVVEPSSDGPARKSTMVLLHGDVASAVEAYEAALARKNAGLPIGPEPEPAPPVRRGPQSGRSYGEQGDPRRPGSYDGQKAAREWAASAYACGDSWSDD